MRLLLPWIDMARWLWHPGLLILAALILAIIGAMAGPWAGRLSPVMRVWPVAYAAYNACAQGPGTSTPRYLLRCSPTSSSCWGWGGAVASGRSGWPTWARWSVLVALSLWLQWKWITTLWHFTPPTDWALSGR
ncbi:MAG: hypothetical protein IPN45_15670 [Actinomycetales bacterium]|nr:hypothetical protein [Actinomycetales bacterium]